jgi:hypothetical protein
MAYGRVVAAGRGDGVAAVSSGTSVALRTVTSGRSVVRAVRDGLLLMVALGALAAFGFTALGHDHTAGAGQSAAVGEHPMGLLRLPAAAQGPISAALGRDAAAYRITGLTATNPAQRLSARFSVGGVMVRSGATRFGLRLNGPGAVTRHGVSPPWHP